MSVTTAGAVTRGAEWRPVDQAPEDLDSGVLFYLDHATLGKALSFSGIWNRQSIRQCSGRIDDLCCLVPPSCNYLPSADALCQGLWGLQSHPGHLSSQRAPSLATEDGPLPCTLLLREPAQTDDSLLVPAQSFTLNPGY